MDGNQLKTKLFANTIQVKDKMDEFIKNGLVEDKIEIEDAG